MKKSVRNLKGELNLSFGMIFSIILIIAFIAFAFYAIQKFLNLQTTIKVNQFKEDLQEDIDRVWKSSQENFEGEYSLPKNIEAVCFENDDYENMKFQSEKFFESQKINHIDIAETLKGEDSVCFENFEGKVSITLKKDYDDALVTLE